MHLSDISAHLVMPYKDFKKKIKKCCAYIVEMTFRRLALQTFSNVGFPDFLHKSAWIIRC